MSNTSTTDAPTPAEWRALGAKRRGHFGWCIRSSRRGPFWLIDVGLITWPNEKFWRVGLCDRTANGIPVEAVHLRYESEREALNAIEWLRAAASGETPT